MIENKKITIFLLLKMFLFSGYLSVFQADRSRCLTLIRLRGWDESRRRKRRRGRRRRRWRRRMRKRLRRRRRGGCEVAQLRKNKAESQTEEDLGKLRDRRHSAVGHIMLYLYYDEYGEI